MEACLPLEADFSMFERSDVILGTVRLEESGKADTRAIILSCRKFKVFLKEIGHIGIRGRCFNNREQIKSWLLDPKS